MAVFTTPVLDNFNRAALGTGWTQYSSNAHVGMPNIDSSIRAACGGTSTPSNKAACWNAATYLDSEVYATSAGWSGGQPLRMGIFARVQNLGGVASCYAFIVNGIGTGGTPTFDLGYQTDDPIVGGFPAGRGAISVAATRQFAFTPGGDKIGLRVFDYSGPRWPGVIAEAWVLYAGTSVWVPVLRLNDYDPGRITSPGYIGFGGACNISVNYQYVDDFGGGSITAPSPTLSDTAIGVMPDGLADDIQVTRNGIPVGNFEGVLPDRLSDDLSQRSSHTGWVSPGAGGVKGL